MQANFVDDNKASVDRIFGKLETLNRPYQVQIKRLCMNYLFSEYFQGFVHNAGGNFHNFSARPSLEEVTKYTNIYSHTFLMLVEKSIPFWERSESSRKSAVAISSPGCNISCPPYVSYLQPGVGKVF